MAVIKRRLLGLAFLVVLALLVSLAIATYNKAFTPAVFVHLKADHVGNQLQVTSDVKIRGLIVGEVRKIESTGENADVTLALDPDYIKLIPSDVQARLLPKTLFGERYVSLVIPEHASTTPIGEDGEIRQDRTQTAIELEQVLNDIMPMLRTLQPDKLNATLTAMATALQGRGEMLGETLVDLGEYLGALNAKMPAIQADITGLANTADTYNSAADDLLAVLSNLSVTSQTVVDQKDALARTFSTVTTASGTLQAFLSDNEQRLIGLAANSQPLLDLLATYSPIYPCFTEGLVAIGKRLDAAFGPPDRPALHLTIEIITDRGQYVPGDEPEYLANMPEYAGQHLVECWGLPNPPFGQENPFPDPAVPDGSDKPPPVFPDGDPSTYGSPLPLGMLDGSGTSLAGSPAELQFVKGILAVHQGKQPGQVLDLTAMIAAPLMRGTDVVLS